MAFMLSNARRSSSSPSLLAACYYHPRKAALLRIKVQFPCRSLCSELKYFGFHFPSPCITCPAVRLRRRSFDGYTVWNLRRRLGWHSSADQRRIVSAELKSEVHVAMRSCGSCAKEGFVLDSEEEFSPVSERSGREEYLVINFYQLVDISSPDEEVARHRSFLQGKDICGRIYVSYQGINAQLGGGTLHLPLTEPSLRAIQLSPRQWRERLCSSVTLEPNHGRGDIANCKSNLQIGKTFVLDVRNGYEWDVGHFRGTHRPRVDCFKNTEFSVLDREGNGNDLLLRVDKESTNILMYCTGGIRCDVYSTYLRQKGFKNLYTLKGGVARYLSEEGPASWLGNLFVFDSRLAVPPHYYKLGGANHIGSQQGMAPYQIERNRTTFAFNRCQLCHGPLQQIRHRNCANLDCNLLHLACNLCSEQHKGCCCVQCMTAPRLRPFLAIPQQFKRWHNY